LKSLCITGFSVALNAHKVAFFSQKAFEVFVLFTFKDYWGQWFGQRFRVSDFLNLFRFCHNTQFTAVYTIFFFFTDFILR